jgi:putative chitinase
MMPLRPALIGCSISSAESLAAMCRRDSMGDPIVHPIDCIDAQLLKIAAPENSISVLAGWADPIKLGCQKFAIDTEREIACLLAQAGHESAGFTKLSENLNYSAQGLANTWPRRFAVDPHATIKAPNALALRIQRNPEAIANATYANRMGNGAPESGDGWLHRGFGPFQITGANNQAAFGRSIGMPLAQVPAYLQTISGGAMSMCWFFQTHGLSDLAATPGCDDETRAINGGVIGLADRQQQIQRRARRDPEEARMKLICRILAGIAAGIRHSFWALLGLNGDQQRALMTWAILAGMAVLSFGAWHLVDLIVATKAPASELANHLAEICKLVIGLLALFAGAVVLIARGGEMTIKAPGGLEISARGAAATQLGKTSSPDLSGAPPAPAPAAGTTTTTTTITPPGTAP